MGYLAMITELTNALQEGTRPTIPADVCAHPNYVALLQKCWAGDPIDRPDFVFIGSVLEGEIAQRNPRVDEVEVDDGSTSSLARPLLSEPW